jgi:hypothetical protein
MHLSGTGSRPISSPAEAPGDYGQHSVFTNELTARRILAANSEAVVASGLRSLALSWPRPVGRSAFTQKSSEWEQRRAIMLPSPSVPWPSGSEATVIRGYKSVNALNEKLCDRLRVRFLRVTMPTGRDCRGNLIGKTLRDSSRPPKRRSCTDGSRQTRFAGALSSRQRR